MPKLDTPEFALNLEDDWVLVVGDTTDRYVFESPLREPA